MKIKYVVMISILCGLLTVALIFNYLNNAQQAMNTVQYGEVVVAAVDVDAKKPLTRDMLQVKKVPVEYIHPQAVRKVDEAVAAITLSPLVQGQQIIGKQLAKANDSKNGLAYIVPTGRRAVTVPVDEVSGVAGLVKPGDRVDVAATVGIPDAASQKEIPYSLLVLQDIQVLAVGRTLDDKGAGAESKSITLAVTVEQSRPLILASQKGTIRLMLRSPVDNGTASTSPFKAADFLQYFMR